MNTNLKIVKATFILVTASIIGHLLSLGKEVIVAAKFGVTKEMDAFYAAITLPNLFNIILLTTFSSVFIPVFVRYKLKEKEEANRVASIVINYFSLFLLGSAILIFILAPSVITYGFHGLGIETRALAIRMLRIVCFILVFSGLIGAMTGILNARQHFAWPAFSPIFVTLTTVVFILVFVKQWAIFVLAYGLLVGLIIQCLFLSAVTKERGYRHYLDFNWRHPAVKQILFLALPYFIVITMAELNIVVDRVMASYLDPGSIAALGYAGKMAQVPLIVFSSSIGIAVFPFFATQVAEDKTEELKDTLGKSIRMIGFIFIPLTVILVILSRPLIQLLFQRGAFTSWATDLTSIIFICYSFQCFFYTAGMILAKVFLAFQDIASLLKITIAGVIMNVILNLIFVRIIIPPAAGIALSTSVVSCITMFFAFLFLKRRPFYLKGKYILQGISKVVISSLFMGIGVFYIFRVFQKFVIFNSTLGQALCLLILGSIGLIIFMGISFILKLPEINKIWELIYARFR